MAMKKIEVIAQGRENASLQLNANPYKAGSWQANAWSEGWQSWHDDAAVTKQAIYDEAVKWKVVARPQVKPCRRAADAIKKVDGVLRRLEGRAKFYRNMPKHRGLYPVY